MNVHKRCQNNVANNCGVNPKLLAETLSAMGISGDKLSRRKKKTSISESPKSVQSITERSHTSPLPSTADHPEQEYGINQSQSGGQTQASHLGRLSFKDSTINREQERALQQVVERTAGIHDEKGTRKCALDDFVFIKVLGKGSFGKVCLLIALSVKIPREFNLVHYYLFLGNAC